MLPLFAAAAKAILASIGEDGLLRGTVPCRINIEHAVQVTGIDAGSRAEDRRDLLVDRDVASIESIYAPKYGDPITVFHQDGSSTNYTLEFAIRDNGALKRFVVMEVF